MTQINETHIEAIIGACQENSAAIAESLNQCFDRQYRIEVGESSVWNADAAADVLDGPGLTVAFGIEQQAVLCLIPESMPLPDWYTAPGDSENSRLQTLALEWSMNMLPAEFEAGEFKSVAGKNLKQQVLEAEPADWAAVIELLVYDEAAQADETQADDIESPDQPDTAEPESEAEPSEESAEESGEDVPPTKTQQPIAKLILIAAVDRPPFPAKPEPPSPQANTNTPAFSGNTTAAANRLSPSTAIDRQMHGLPVTVSVRLAEKKIELGQLVAITPGGLVTFGKGCESLLDLYVNNHLYGRGEAIKVGEKFGLKVTEVGIQPERRDSVL